MSIVGDAGRWAKTPQQVWTAVGSLLVGWAHWWGGEAATSFVASLALAAATGVTHETPPLDRPDRTLSYPMTRPTTTVKSWLLIPGNAGQIQ